MTDHIATLERMENAIHTLLLIGDRPLETAPEDVQAEVEALRAAIALMRGQSWQDIATIPRDGTTVELLSENGRTDRGNWYNWPGAGDDVQVHLNTDNGEGNYTHWRPIKTGAR